MNKTLISGACAVCLGSVAFTTTAATFIVNDDFEYADQAAYQAVWAPVGTSAQLSTDQASSGTKSIFTPGTGVNSTSRNRRTFAETGTISDVNRLTFSFDFYDTGGAPARNYSNLQDTTAPTATSQLISLGLNNNQTVLQSGGDYYMARILGFTPSTTADPDGGPAESVASSGSYFKLNDFGVGLRSVGWHNLRVDIFSSDNLSTDYWFFVDGLLAEKVENVGTAASIRSYDNITLGSGLSNNNQAAYFDNMILVVPEPSSLSLALLGGFGLLVARMRRQ